MPEDEQIQKTYVLQLLQRHSSVMGITNSEKMKRKRAATGRTDMKCYRNVTMYVCIKLHLHI